MILTNTHTADILPFDKGGDKSFLVWYRCLKISKIFQEKFFSAKPRLRILIAKFIFAIPFGQ
eukprot:TRINITY_DN491_c0_g1_i2.p2 TRINITY_DN491_c0_g1~~TRINITY_DN491_c0_g1_i2.p2  ORF type:complete len:62 (+),score=3.40 TRINITY_DN491_c0_g1_i2:1679-1864(+)